MKFNKAKIVLLIALAVFTFFFSNDFGLIDVEKTSIITAIAIDKEGEDYLLTAQIAVPEATDTNTENQKAQIGAKGKTIGEALKNIGDVSGWFPKLAFCNLIILGNSLSNTNVVDVLDYFAKTLRVQNSALVAIAENKASDLLGISTPLDNISSFAIQKILLKNPGFDREVISSDVKTFCSGHYSLSGSSYMPLIKVISPDGKEDNTNGENQSGEHNSSGGNSEQSGSGSSSSSGSEGGEQKKKENLFDARTTALFKDGVMVGQLDSELTTIFSAFILPLDNTTISFPNVPQGNKTCNYLITVISSKPDICVSANENELNVKLSLSLFCKVTDVNTDNTDEALSQDKPLSKPLIDKAENMLKERIEKMVQTSRRTECDFLKIKEKLYRYNYKQYSRYKDNYLSVMNVGVSVDVYGQS